MRWWVRQWWAHLYVTTMLRKWKLLMLKLMSFRLIMLVYFWVCSWQLCSPQESVALILTHVSLLASWLETSNKVDSIECLDVCTWLPNSQEPSLELHLLNFSTKNQSNSESTTMIYSKPFCLKFSGHFSWCSCIYHQRKKKQSSPRTKLFKL